jgi:hypothetical protein
MPDIAMRVLPRVPDAISVAGVVVEDRAVLENENFNP